MFQKILDVLNIDLLFTVAVTIAATSHIFRAAIKTAVKHMQTYNDAIDDFAHLLETELVITEIIEVIFAILIVAIS